MNMKPEICNDCILGQDGRGFTAPEGLGSLGVLIMAEASGSHEADEGLPLRPYAPAGSVFEGLIRRIKNLDRKQLLISNVVRCQPPKNWLLGAPWEYEAIEHCQQHAKKLVESRRPRCILALGALPTRTITGYAGYNQGIKLLRGFQLFASRSEYFVDGQPLPVVATYHPSFLLRASKTRSKGGKEGKEDLGTGARVEKAEGGMSLAGACMRDIQLAMRIAKFGPIPKPKVEIISGGREVMEELIRQYENHPEWGLFWDIETPRSFDKAADESEIDSISAHVKQIQFTHCKERGWVFPGGFENEWCLEGTRKLMAMHHRKFTHNGKKFDVPIVHGHYGIPINGEQTDLMEKWHWIQPDLPRGLQFVTSFFWPEHGPWKHLALSNEEEYGVADVVTMVANEEGISKIMEEKGLRTSFDRHCQALGLEMQAASRRGLPMDEERHEEFGRSIGARIDVVDTEIQTLIPEPLFILEPKKKKEGVTEFGYVKTPKKLEQYLFVVTEDGEITDRLVEPAPIRIVVLEEVEEEDEDGPTGEFWTKEVVYVHKELLPNLGVFKWHRQKPFAVGSPEQKLNYIKFRKEEEIQGRMEKGQDRATAERLAKYQVPIVKNKDKEKKENTGGKELDKLFKATGDKVFQLLVEITTLKKLHGTYGPKGWITRNGYVHTTFGVSDTGTGQLTSKSPNVQNAVKHSDLANQFRACICAKPGKVLIEIDKKSFHAQTLAFEAKDKAYARISALDVHSYVTAHRLKLPDAPNLMKWSDADINGYFDKLKEDKFLYKGEAVPAYPEGMTFKQIRNFKSKKAILGLGFAQGAGSIYDQNPEGYKNKAEVQAFKDLIFATFDKLVPFQTRITKEAHLKCELISRWGYIRKFYDVFQWDPKKWNKFTNTYGDWGHGDDFEAAVAFLPANDAFGMLKEEMLRLAGFRLGDLGNEPPGAWEVEDWPSYQKTLITARKHSEDLLAKYGFVNQIHDSLIFHCDYSLKDRCIEDVVRIMREPCLTLTDPEMAPNGLFVDVSVECGPDWASMKGVKI